MCTETLLHLYTHVMLYPKTHTQAPIPEHTDTRTDINTLSQDWTTRRRQIRVTTLCRRKTRCFPAQMTPFLHILLYLQVNLLHSEIGRSASASFFRDNSHCCIFYIGSSFRYSSRKLLLRKDIPGFPRI